MPPVVTYPDPVLLARTYLDAQLPAETIVARIPNPRPARLVYVRRAGGTRANLVYDRPNIDVQVWAATEYDAAQLAASVRAHLLAAPTRVTGVIRAEDFTGPTPIPDPESDSPRYLLTVTWHVRGSES